MEQPTDKQDFHSRLREKMDWYVHEVYRLTKKYPRDEIYGVTSQIRRSTLSVILNYIEGYARKRSAVHKNFLEISYGSLQESKYLLEFSLKENYITQEEFEKIAPVANEIGAMLWSTISKL
jgi:four helix bundle protein